MTLREAVARRRTFAIISHPDAGKTTITEKLLLHGHAIALAGTVKARKSRRAATSDWMAMERARGISVTTSVMQFPYRQRVVNLLDTPGHEDFSEDTYRTLTAVDAALMVIDGAKGVEPRTKKLLEVCRLRDTPILTFINKLDRDIRDPVALLDEVEAALGIACAPITWPIGAGRRFRGAYHLTEDRLHCFERGHGHERHDHPTLDGCDSAAANAWLGEDQAAFQDELELVRGASHPYDRQAFLAGRQTPVFFGTALGNFGVDHLLSHLVEEGPCPGGRAATSRQVAATEERFTGFVFKIQANMDPKHRDRIAFLRVCSGRYRAGMRLHHVRTGTGSKAAEPKTFFAGERAAAEEAVAGDIIGLHNHGTIQIGDTFTEGETLRFTGVPSFAPELFRRVRVRDPLKSKQLDRGVRQLAEEGATQVFVPERGRELIVGAIGALQFDLVAFRLRDEYRADCTFDESRVAAVRWLSAEDDAHLTEFKAAHAINLATDAHGQLAYLAPSHANLQLVQERWPDIRFAATREHA